MTTQEKQDEHSAAIFARVAPYLGEGWTARPPDPQNRVGGWLDGPNGAVLFSWGGYRAGRTDRLAISGHYAEVQAMPYNDQPRVERYEITVAKDRDPKAIAREIERRLLPEYLAELERVRGVIAEQHVAADQQTQAKQALCDIFGLARATNDGISWYQSGDAVSYGDVRLYHDGSKGELEIRSASFSTIARLVSVLAEIREEEMAAEQSAMIERAHSKD